MAQIIWEGNKNWENVWDGKQPWDREIEEKSIPENAVLIDRPDDIIKASIPYMIIPCIVCFVAIFTKKAQSDEFIFNLWFMPLSFIIEMCIRDRIYTVHKRRVSGIDGKSK